MTNQNIANVVVAVLKEVEMDGEMMEWIINQVGMRDQMELLRQLILLMLSKLKSANANQRKGVGWEQEIMLHKLFMV